MGGLVTLLSLMSSADRSDFDFFSSVFFVLVGMVFVGTFGAPLASVARAYEYDLLHALNTPEVLARADQHLGENMLPHLQALEWGFRFGQTVINMKVITSILA